MSLKDIQDGTSTWKNSFIRSRNRYKASSTAKDFHHFWDEGNVGGETTLRILHRRRIDGTVDQIIYLETPNSASVHDPNAFRQLMGSARSGQHCRRLTAQVGVVQQSGDFLALSASPQVNITC